MTRIFALATVAVLTAAAVGQDQNWADKTVRLRTTTRLGTRQAGGILRDGAEVTLGQTLTVKSDDGVYLEFVDETGVLFKTEVELFAGREMPRKGAPAPKIDPAKLWAAGAKVLAKRSANQVQFGDRDEKGRSTFFTLTGISFVVVRDNGDGWVRVRDRYREGWVVKDDLVPKEAAVAHFDALLKADPQNSWALFMRAASNNENGKHDAAIADYTEYLKLSPNSSAALNNRGTVWINKKEYDKAIEDFTTVLKADPKYAVAYSNRGHALLNKKDYEKAVADCDRAIELDPQFAAAVWYRARALAKLKKYDAATAGFESAAKLDPSAARLNSLAWHLATCPDEKHRDGKKAVEAAKKAVALDGAWGFRDTLAAAHAAAGDFEAAVTELQKALEAKAIPAGDRKTLEARLELFKAKKAFRDDE
ncbi:lipoprotein NlpI [Gemmata obscuriglobus]|uniref:Tetratricopeptide repeat protein n=1 Tax=Gemmata obscuriglobus TaxID=114 RepID=A0A2Z3H7N9_9BACT|nr:tetratricopeptide repeat protein [Gemmata obscuriglobus]AWM40851.1 tetratricopeptide repeat protein [Gemmata obscuriglobus]QEG25859.1 lipoprotein NlpI [Gemmata obscuriglobus]VTR99855.1 peptidase c14 caspase catalytic subunit p20 : Tetratricopeptide repeat protein OS=Singulisphaera acidiphila (strain ATCC BAA-1392 / DSM 18658 / VKM B-2454 / MOB10) GN=Sinac_0326 PE=4 SV=1: TPR_11: TPR_11: TPR_2: TPR_9 [Gemmata obscuriglobus UQM 2246]